MADDAGESVGVTLFPADYETVAMVTEQGDEMLQEDFTEAQLFVHAIQELERARAERSKKKKTAKSKEGEDAVEDPQSIDDEAAIGELPGDDVVMKEEPLETDGLKENGVHVGSQEADGQVKEEQDDVDVEEDVIDPRIYYRPMVAELQASVVELHQLINSIDLIRRRDFLEEMRCIRENTAPKKEDVDYLLESKATQLKEANRILLDGVDALTATVEKESIFFQGVTQMLRKWKVIAPIHGNIPKPFRAGESLAVDCSYVSAGSTFVPMTRSIADVAFAELSRTEKGLVRVKTPDDFLPRTIELSLESLETGVSGHYTLPVPQLVTMSKAEMDRLENTPDDLKTLDARNVSILKAVQFSVFCEELFYNAMREALQASSNWTDTAYSVGNYSTQPKQRGSGRESPSGVDGNISVLQVLDDEIQFRVSDKFKLTLRLIDAQSLATKEDSPGSLSAVGAEFIPTDVDQTEAADTSMEPVIAVKVEGVDVANGTPDRANVPPSPVKRSIRQQASKLWVDPLESDEAFLSETCRYTASLLQQEMRQHHGRKEIARALMYNSEGITHPSATSGNLSSAVSSGMQLGTDTDHRQESGDASGGILSTVLAVVAHNLLKFDVTRYLDGLSAVLALQNMQVSASGRVLDDGLMQPICDSVRGVYVGVRWKTCAYDSTVSAFDLSIGKNFTTEVLLSGTRIQFRGLSAGAALQEASGLAGLKSFVERAVCTQVATSLHRDALSFGIKQVSMDLDRASVRVFAAGEWDGSCIGDGRVSDSKAVGSLYFEPFFAADQSLSISCTAQAIDVSSLHELALAVPVHTSASASSAFKRDLHKVDWARIPGSSDVAKLAWLLERADILPRSLTLPPRATIANGFSS